MLLNRINKYLAESIEDEEEQEEEHADMSKVEEINDHPAWNLNKFDYIGGGWPSAKEIAEKFGCDIKTAGKAVEWCYESMNDMLPDDIDGIFTYVLKTNKRPRLEYKDRWILHRDWWIEDFKEADVREYLEIKKDLDALRRSYDSEEYVYDMIEHNGWCESIDAKKGEQ